MYGPAITKRQFLNLLIKYGEALTAGHQFFDDLAPNTIRNYRVGCANLLSVCLDNWGNHPDGPLLAKDAQLIVDDLIDEKGPGSARATVACMGSILSFMILYTDLCQNTYNPFDMIKVPTSENIPAWTKDQIENHLTFGTPFIRQLVAILYETAQRLSDVLFLSPVHIWANSRGGAHSFIEIVQSKTGTKVQIPILSGGLMCQHIPNKFETMPILGEGSTNTVRYKYKFHCEKRGITPLPLHGLRKSAVLRMIEAGATEFEIMAITGHKSASSLRSYIGGYDKNKAGVEAYRKVQAYGNS